MTMFGTVGISHHLASADIRDRVAFSEESAFRFRESLRESGVGQSVTLSTCNRTEVYFWGPENALETVRTLFERTFSGVSLSGVLECRTGVEALTYLCSVAAGLESMILGEYQILGQVKDAYAAALASGHVGKELDRILRDAVSAAKRVKTDLDIGAVPPSVCRAGMAYVDRMVGVSGKHVFVIGSGKTGSLAVALACEFGAASVSVCNRSPERAKKLEAQFGARIVDYSLRHDVIVRSDIVVSATASPHLVIHADRAALRQPVFFLDLASPRDVDPDLAKNPLATVVSIDTIGELARGDREERERLTARGREIIAAVVTDLSGWLGAVVRGRCKRG